MADAKPGLPFVPSVPFCPSVPAIPSTPFSPSSELQPVMPINTASVKAEKLSVCLSVFFVLNELLN
ncbi:hypothetical protein P4S63_06555 [Pseudoalteromonas sp. B193]